MISMKDVRINKLIIFNLILVFTTGIFAGCGINSSDQETVATKTTVEITNVSYDPTREMYEEYNKEFQKYWKEKTGQKVNIIQSHGGSGKQGRSVIEGIEADVVSLALTYDINAIEQAGLIEEDWQSEFEYNSSPYTSTIVFLVRKGNPKSIYNWEDLVRDDIDIITPNPKTSGGARWIYLAAWAYADEANNHEENKIKEYIKQLYQNVSVLDSGARGSTITFVENGQGDILLAWENEAYLSIQEHPEEYEIITPSISILAEPPVAIVDDIVEDRGTREIATEYLKYLYSDIGQRIVGANYYRPSNPEIAQEFTHIFNFNLKLVTIDDEIFGGWNKAQSKHFSDGGIFDEIYSKKKASNTWVWIIFRSNDYIVKFSCFNSYGIANL